MAITRRDFTKGLAAGVGAGMVPSICSAWQSSQDAAPLPHDATTVFRIGEFNGSSGEFAPGDPAQAVNFVVGQSSAAKDWFQTQPAVPASAPGKQQTGVAAAPRAITFSVAATPAASYFLRVALLIESSGVPVLRLGINGREGVFYLHPKLDYRGGDQGSSFDPAYSAADVEFAFPGDYLRTGSNTITLQAVTRGKTAVPDTRITYDAIELDSVPSPIDAAAVSALLTPTIFFVQQAGGLKERVDAFFRTARQIQPGGSAELRIAGRHYLCELSGGFDFGEVKAEFLVSEFATQSRAELTVRIGRKTNRFHLLLNPKKKWTVFVVPLHHLDVGYSDYQAKVSAVQARLMDEALTMIDQHPDFRFSLDGEWVLQQFMETRTEADRQRALDAIRQKKLFVPAQYANLLTGLPGPETLIRSLYPSANFSNRYGTPFNYANITDVPSYSWSYPSILASAGIPYLAAAANNFFAPVLLQGRLNEHSPAWWEGPDGKRVLLWYSRHYEQMQMLFGLPPVTDAGEEMLPLFLQMYERQEYKANATILYGTQVENTDLFASQAELVQRWNATHAYPRLQYAGFHQAMETIQNQFGDAIPTIRGDGGPYWESGVASDAYYEATQRRTEARAQTAEKLATLLPFVNPVLSADKSLLDRMWQNMVLMDEHTWDSYDSVWDRTSSLAAEQPRVKNQFAVNAAAQADLAVKRSMANLAYAIPAGPNSLIVFNSLNWRRSGMVTFDLQKGHEIADSRTNVPVPYEILYVGAEFVRARFVAQDLPAVGYRVYQIRPQTKVPAAAQAVQGSTLESRYYRVQLDPSTGAVRSIYDKELQRELVDLASPYRFGQYLYVTGGDKAPNTLLGYSSVDPRPDVEVHPTRDGKVVSVVRTPSGQVAHLQSQNVNTPSIRTEIRLFDDEKKIEFIQDVEKTMVYSKEAAYFAFPFAMRHPRFQYEIQTGVVDPAKDMYPGAGHVWFSVQHWASVEQDGLAGTVFPLDAPLLTLGDINRGEWPETFGDRPGTIFSYVMNNYWNTNDPAGQGGEFQFRYVVTSADATQAGALSRMGWEEATPLEKDFITSQDKAMVDSVTGTGESGAEQSAAPASAAPIPLNANEESFLNTADSDVLLSTWKPAEDGHGTILRFLELSGVGHTVSVQLPYLHLEDVWLTDAVERGQKAIATLEDNSFQFTIHPHEIVTLRAVTEASPASS